MKSLLLFALMFISQLANANVIMSPRDFLASCGLENSPSNTLWLSSELQAQAQDILSHPYKGIRIRYWRNQTTSAWVLNEVGKEEPITYGVMVEDGKIKAIEVLVFREVRGDEIKSEPFKAQFLSASLTDDYSLDRHIDGITGATYSVRSMKKVARLALLLDQAVKQ